MREDLNRLVRGLSYLGCVGLVWIGLLPLAAFAGDDLEAYCCVCGDCGVMDAPAPNPPQPDGSNLICLNVKLIGLEQTFCTNLCSNQGCAAAELFEGACTEHAALCGLPTQAAPVLSTRALIAVAGALCAAGAFIARRRRSQSRA